MARIDRTTKRTLEASGSSFIELFGNTGGSYKLTPNNVYQAKVTTVDPVARTVDVLVSDSVIVYSCVCASMSYTNTIGFSDVGLPPVGTTVILLYTGDTSYIIGGAGSLSMQGVLSSTVGQDMDTGLNELITGLGVEPTEGEKITNTGLRGSADLLPGERQISNNLGVDLTMTYNMASLSSGGLATVETHLLNDMVRITDNNYAHHSAAGDELIWADKDGHVNREAHFTGYGFEAEGRATEYEPLGSQSLAELFKTEEEVDDYNATGRWRGSTYEGYLGNGKAFFMSEPTEEATTYSEDASRAGTARTWVGNDGTVLAQSAGGIHLEVTPNIVVPTVHNKWNHPDYADADAASNAGQYSTLWGSGPLWDDIKMAPWQMESYSRYISQYHSLARFREDPLRYTVLPETEAPEPSPTSQEKDKEEANPSASLPYSGHASIHLDPSGSITILGGDGSSIIMSNGSIQISAAANIELIAADTLSITAKKVAIAALSDISIVSIAGALVTKARTAVKTLCELGKIWFKTDAKKEDNASVAKDKWPLDSTDAYTEPEIEDNGCGIIFDAVNTGVAVHGANGIYVGSTEEDSAIKIMNSGKNGNVDITARESVQLAASENVAVKAKHFASDFDKAFTVNCSSLGLGQNINVEGGTLNVNGTIKATSMYSQGGFMGPSDVVNKVSDSSKLKPDMECDAITEGYAVVKNTVTDLCKGNNIISDHVTHDSWQLPYILITGDVTSSTSLKESPTIRHAMTESESDTEDATSAAYEKMEWYDSALLPSTRTGIMNLPWPGRSASYYKFTPTDIPSLGEKWDRLFDTNDIGGVSKMTESSYTAVFKK